MKAISMGELYEAFRLDVFLEGLARHLGLALLLEQRTFVLAAFKDAQLVLELEVALEPAGVEFPLSDRRLHGASGLVAVPAVGEMTSRTELLDILERLA